ncbi:hypothetical protein VTL71DRAFT_6194 [Oculimacula yallundae]|uniref:Uncharacterized protein n=1 Tax=Oculimacula yallundae TaxID=86028 RepID=A0ABR4C0M4_9HELO
MAIDTMGILPEGTFYRYVQDCKGITVTRRELKGFLSQCYERRQLFIWEPFPSPGWVVRVAAGWPPAPVYSNRRQLIDPHFQPDPRKVDILRLMLSDDLRLREELYLSGGEMRDVSFESFRRLLELNVSGAPSNPTQPEKNDLLRDRKNFYDLIVSSAGAPNGSGIGTFTLGPKSIIRLTYPVEQYRAKHLNPHLKLYLPVYKEIEARWNAAWQAELDKEKSGGASGPSPSTT